MYNKAVKKWVVLAVIVLVVGIGWWIRKPAPSEKMKVEVVATGLEVPWAIAWTSSTRMLVTERPGRIRVIENGKLEPDPLVIFSDVSTGGEDGLMGMAVDKGQIYVCLSYKKTGKQALRVERLIDSGDKLIRDKVIWDNVPSATFHTGCRVKFGPDGKLYFTAGDALNKAQAQDVKSFAGKILRVNADGSDPEIWAYGLRNPQGLAWDDQKNLWATDHGPSGFDGPAGGDEINSIVEGGNYGWPLVSHEKTRPGTVAPVKVYTPAIAPSGIAWWRGKLWYGGLKGEGLYTIEGKVAGVEVGRVREAMVGPDGAMYITTSNRDGRGKVLEGDDKIIRLSF